MMTILTRDLYLWILNDTEYLDRKALADHDQAQRAVIEKLKRRLRVTAQLGIEAVGADGPEDAESVVGRMTAKIEQQAKEIATLRGTLQLLYDCQNGCPLPKYESDWNRAMELAAQALKEVS